jgi:sugar phosphate isomerase/epimerase
MSFTFTFTLTGVSVMPTRREFLTASAAAVALSSMTTTTFADEGKSPNSLCVFTKPFNSLTADQLGAKIAELGFNGIEAPIRAGGHIEPDAVPDQLPKFVETLRKHNVDITVMTTDINDPNDPQTEKVLRTAAKAGLRFYRMKYFKYDENQSITGQIDAWHSQLKDLAAMNRELGVTGLYQNHAGRNYFGAPIWDLHRGLDGIDPAHLGMAYDIRHATVEAGMSWPIGFHLMRPHIQVVYVKDFVWGETKSENVPLGEGRVDSKFFKMLADSKFTGPISLHEEYLDHTKPELVPQHWNAITADLKTLKSWL